jgi:hypothetical protein
MGKLMNGCLRVKISHGKTIEDQSNFEIYQLDAERFLAVMLVWATGDAFDLFVS